MESVEAVINILWWVLVPIIVIVGGIWSHRNNQREIRRWRRWALARHWQFVDQMEGLHKAFSGGPFGRGSSRKADRGYHGTFDGVPVMGFRYQYEQGSGDNSTTFWYQVQAVRVPGARFPRMSLSLETWGSRMSRDLQFEDAEFNRMWNVRSESPRFAHDVCHPRAMEFLKRGLPDFHTLWFENDCILIARSGQPKMEYIDAYFRVLTDFTRLLPPFVLKEVGSNRLPLDHSGPGVSQEEQARRIAQLEATEN